MFPLSHFPLFPRVYLLPSKFEGGKYTVHGLPFFGDHDEAASLGQTRFHNHQLNPQSACKTHSTMVIGLPLKLTSSICRVC